MWAAVPAGRALLGDDKMGGGGNPDKCRLVEERYNSTWIDPRSRPGVTYALAAMYVLGLVFVLSTAVVIRWKWNRYERLRMRGFVFFLTTTLGVLVFLQSGPLQEILGKRRISCVWNLVSSNMVVPLVAGSLVARLLDSMNKTNLARAIIRVPLSQAESTTGTCSGCNCCWGRRTGTNRRSISSRFESAESLPANGRRANSSGNGAAYRTGRQTSSADYGANSSPVRSREVRGSSAATPRPSGLANVSDHEFHFWRRLSSKPGRIMMMSLILLPFVIVSVGLILAEPELYLNGCYGCAFSQAGLYVLVFTGVAAFVFAAITSWRIRHFPDPYGVVEECRWGFLYGGLPAIIFFVLDKWEPFFRGHPHFSWIIPEVLAMLLLYFVHGPLQLYLAIRADRFPRESKRNPKVGEGREDGGQETPDTGSVSFQSPPTTPSIQQNPELEDVLDDPHGRKLFENFLVSIWAAESLRFYTEAVSWHNDFHTIGQRTALSRARRIVRIFVDLNGSMTVNLRADVVDELMQVFDPDFQLNDTFFHSAIDEILRLMRADSFYRFRHTRQYAEFADEWRRRMEESGGDPTFTRQISKRFSKRFSTPLAVEPIIMTINGSSSSASPRRGDEAFARHSEGEEDEVFSSDHSEDEIGKPSSGDALALA